MVIISDQPFDPWRAIQDFQQEQHWSGKFGATASFVGTMRDFNAGDRVNAMFLEHYPSMTEKYLQKLVSETNSAFGLLDSLIVHRVGEIRPADPIVLIACWSAHRAAAFDACRHAMEKLKSEAPFWKKERLEESSRWVSGLTSE